MKCHGQTDTRRLKKKEFNKRIHELLTKKLKKNQDVEHTYAWFLAWHLICSNETKEQTIDFIRKYQNENENKNENENENEDESEKENEDEDEGVHVDENNIDPDYCLFLENLTEHGKSYKLKITQNDEEPRFVYYEEQDNSDWCDEVTVSEDMHVKQKAITRLNEKNDRISTKKEVSRRKESNDHKSIAPGINMDPCYKIYLPGLVKEEPVEYEKNVTASYSYSDSDVLILDNVQNCSEENNKQLALAEKEPSLREKLMHILEHPYNEKEYKELSEYIEQEKPVCQLKPLRNGRSRLFANSGVKKSVLNYGPERFRKMLNAAQNDRPKALNLLRMFRFWLEHVPNDDAFQPWRDQQILMVRPSEKNAVTRMQKQQLQLLTDK